MRLMISLTFSLFTLSLFITSGYGGGYTPHWGCPPGKTCCKHGFKWYWSTGGSSYSCISEFGREESKHCDYGKVFDVIKCYCVRPAFGCKWSPYGNWKYIDQCSKPCGGGYRRKRGTRTKDISHNPQDKCEGDYHKTISVPCNTDSCVHMCEETSPYAPANGYRRADSDTAPYYPGEIITFKCKPCYELVGDDDDIECTYGGYWDGPVPTCRKIKCSSVEAPQNGYIKYADRYCDGKTKFACDEGYELVGYAEIICLENGTYNYDPPKCVPDCRPEWGQWKKVYCGDCQHTGYGGNPCSKKCTYKRDCRPCGHGGYPGKRNTDDDVELVRRGGGGGGGPSCHGDSMKYGKEPCDC